MTAGELHDTDPADSIARGARSLFSGIGGAFNGAVRAMDEDAGARSLGQWASFGLTFLIGQQYARQGAGWLMDRIPGMNALPEPIRNVISGGMGIGFALALASGLSSWFANSRDPSQLGNYLREGFTDTIGMVSGLFGGAASGLTDLFNRDSGAADDPAADRTTGGPAAATDPLAIAVTEMTPQVLQAALNAGYTTPSQAFVDGNDALDAFIIQVPEIEARITAANEALRAVVEGQSLDFMGGNFTIEPVSPGSTEYAMVPTGGGASVTLTQEQYDAIKPAVDARNTAIEALGGFRDDVLLHNELARNAVGAFYEFNTALTAAGLEYGSGEFDMANIVRAADGDYYYKTAEGQGIRLEGLTEEGFTELQRLHTAFTERLSAYNDKVDALQARTDLPEGVTLSIADGPTSDVETFYDNPTPERVTTFTM